MYVFQLTGAEVQRLRPVSITHPEHPVNVARRRAAEVPGAVFADQFENLANLRAHLDTGWWWRGGGVCLGCERFIDVTLCYCTACLFVLSVKGIMLVLQASIQTVLPIPPPPLTKVLAYFQRSRLLQGGRFCSRPVGGCMPLCQVLALAAPSLACHRR